MAAMVTGKWIALFERCIGRNTNTRFEETCLLRTETPKSPPISEVNSTPKDAFSANQWEDSAYFSDDEPPDLSGVTKTDGVSDNSAVMNGDVILSECHQNQTCDDLTEHQELVTNLCRISSIQDRSLRITRRRHEKVAMKKRTRGKEGFTEHSLESDDVTSTQPDLESQLVVPNESALARASSLQIRYWEIRQKRKNLLHKRRSRGFEGTHP